MDWRTRIFILLAAVTYSQCESQTKSADLITATASFSQRGIQGDVTFTEVNHLYVEVKVDIQGIRDGASLNWEIRSLPVTQGDNCSDHSLGSVFQGGTLGWIHGYLRQNSVQTFRETRATLDGRRSIVGRSLLLTNVNNPAERVCATILPPKYQIAEARVVDAAGKIEGSITFLGDEKTGNVKIMPNLYFVMGTEAQNWEWTMYGEVYNPSKPVSDQEFDHVIADLSSDLGPVQIGDAPGSTKYLWTYTRIFFSELVGRSIVLFDSNLDRRAAANILTLDPTTFKAVFMFDQIEFGSVTLTQPSRFSPTQVAIDLPEVKNLLILESSCEGGIIYNPLNVTEISPGGATHDAYAIGNIAARHAPLHHHFVDHNLPLHGENSVYGKHVKVVLKDDTVVCTTLKKDSIKSASEAEPEKATNGRESMQDDERSLQTHQYRVNVTAEVDDTLSVYTVRWGFPAVQSSKEVIAHRIYYKEYGLEEVIGFKDIVLDRNEAVIIDEFRDLEFRWVELLSDDSEGLATPYFTTSVEGMFNYNLALSQQDYGQLMLDWDMPKASDQFMDVIPEYIVEWQAKGGPHYKTQIVGSSKAVITDLIPRTSYSIRVQQVRLGTRMESQLPWVEYLAGEMSSPPLGLAPPAASELSRFKVRVERVSPTVMRVRWAEPPFAVNSYSIYYKKSGPQARKTEINTKNVFSGGAANLRFDSLERSVDYEFQVIMSTGFGKIETSWFGAGEESGLSISRGGSINVELGDTTSTTFNRGTSILETVATDGFDTTGEFVETVITDGSSSRGVIIQSPGEFRGTAEGNTVFLSWIRPPSVSTSILRGYLVSYTTDSRLPSNDGAWQATVVGAGSLQQVFRNLRANTWYYFRIRSRGSAGDGPYSEVIRIKTGPKILSYTRGYLPSHPLPSPGSADLRWLIESSGEYAAEAVEQVPGFCGKTGFNEHSEANSALRLTKNSQVTIPTKDAFPDGFSTDFSIMVTYKASITGVVPLFSIASGSTAESALALKISPDSVQLIYSDTKNMPGPSKSPVWTGVRAKPGEWRRLALSVKGNSVALLDDCVEVGSRVLERSVDTALDIQGVVFIGREFGSENAFEGDIQDVLIVGDPSSAYDMCQVYRPDCQPISGVKADINRPDEAGSSTAPSRGRIEYVPGEMGPPGSRGAPGPMGPKGNSGAPGRDGMPGMDGMPGPAGHVIVIPMAPGGSSSKGPSGAAQNARMALMQQMASMRGAPGPQGLTGQPGPVGPNGPMGPKGESGSPGEQGMPGTRGNPGHGGPPGRRGKSGTQGERGEPGPTGSKGDSGYPGVYGNPGAKGDIGMHGDPGPAGQEGLRGLPGDHGPTGPDGSVGDPGPRGFIGPRGSPGPAGAPGAPGVEGSPGPKGDQGASGPSGPPGSAGVAGPNGAPGPAGSLGPPGQPGSDGQPGMPGLPGSDGQAGFPGQKGSDGAKGERGPEGPRGMPGAPGLQGNKGTSGARGFPGQKGEVGLQGMDGPVGDTGMNGDRGQKGESGPFGMIGDSGPKGDRGNVGEPGPLGPQGEKGPMGMPGFAGYPGPPGQKGSRGQSGRKGKLGEKGAAGPRGVMGERGSLGPMGQRGERGNPGPQGPVGVQGNQGAPGPTGEPGPQGAPGPEGQPGFQGPMGPPGTSGNDGMPGPMGERGAPGLPGDPGQPGPVGVVGQSGPPGPIGPSGERGDPGLSGPPGPAGFPGDPGRTGFPGPPGPMGAQGQGLGVPGAPGPVGSKGDNGPPGKDGETGPSGRRGSPGERGFRGAPGPVGQTGDAGVVGQAGPRGNLGPMGPKGARGGDGPSGKDGPVGAQGPPGMPGPQGISGPPGEEGAPGPQGLSGPKGDKGAEGSQGPPGLIGPIGPRGAPGSQGPSGERGERGDQGMNGMKGSGGPPGAPGLPGIMGKQGMPGAPGTKGESGDKGKTGAPGPVGPAGAIGQSGPRGEPGLPGPEGPGGMRGYPGRRGESGQPGTSGEAGKPGSPGSQVGPPGSSGPPGPTGPPGDRGSTGEPGPKGPAGSAGIPGQAGPSGIMGSKGERGKDGKNGNDGPTGPQGPEGSIGEAGAPGPRGTPGNDGNPGLVGPPGPAGESGEQGAQGSQGMQGPPGGPGNAGAKGALGASGQPGPSGDSGPPGMPGKPGDTGPIGDPGLPGVKGETGEKGDKGDQGLLGPPGPSGILGEKGQTGPSGLPGREGVKGQAGPIGAPGAPGPDGPSGLPGAAGTTGPKGDSGRDGPPGMPGPAGAPGIGADLSTPISSGFAEKTLRRRRRSIRQDMVADEPQQNVFDMPPSPTLGHVIEKIFQDIDDLKAELDEVRYPNGGREAPARSCKDLYLAHPEFKDGWYWIDPNLGVINDAIQVWCNMTAEGETCVYPKKGHDMVIPRNWQRPNPNKPSWFSTLKGGFQVEYAHESQISFLRLIYTSASQKMTYFCSNAVAYKDGRTASNDKSITLLGNNDFEFGNKSLRKKYVLRDGCENRPTNGFTIFQISTSKVHQLPIVDIEIKDFGESNQKFGFEMGPVCFGY